MSILSAEKIDRLGSRLATLVSSASEKVKTAAERTLTKETPLERQLREALSDKNWGCANSVLGEIARASYTYSDFSVISKSLWEALAEPPKRWRRIFKEAASAQGLSLLEYLLKNGESGFAAQARDKSYLLRLLQSFSLVEDGRDKGAGIREKAELCVNLAFDANALKEARAVAARNREKFIGLSSASCTAASGSGRRAAAQAGGFGNHFGSGDASSQVGARGRRGSSQSPPRSASSAVGGGALQSASSEGRRRKAQDFSRTKGGTPATTSARAAEASSGKDAKASQFSDLLGLDDDEPASIAAPGCVGAASSSNLPGSLEAAFSGHSSVWPQQQPPASAASASAPSDALFTLPPPPPADLASMQVSSNPPLLNAPPAQPPTPAVALSPAWETETSTDDIFGGFQGAPAAPPASSLPAPFGSEAANPKTLNGASRALPREFGAPRGRALYRQLGLRECEGVCASGIPSPPPPSVFSIRAPPAAVVPGGAGAEAFGSLEKHLASLGLNSSRSSSTGNARAATASGGETAKTPEAGPAVAASHAPSFSLFQTPNSGAAFSAAASRDSGGAFGSAGTASSGGALLF